MSNSTTTRSPSVVTLSPTAGPTQSTGCVDPSASTLTWVLLGVLIALAFFSGVLTQLLFRGISGACKRYNVRTFDQAFRKLFQRPVAVLFALLFLQIAWEIAPWLCSLAVVKSITGFLILCAALTTVWVVILRLFDFAELFIRVFAIDAEYIIPLREGLRVLKLIALFSLGIVFFSIIVVRLDPGSQFRLGLFFSSANFISLMYMFFFVPLIRDAIGGLTHFGEDPRFFRANDWIEIDGARGVVERIGLFAVTLRTLNGSVTMISNSRFLESMFIVYPESRRRLVEFRVPLKFKGDVVVEEHQRSVLAAIERALDELMQNDVCVLFDNDPVLGQGVQVRFVTSETNSVETQVAAMNDAILKVLEATADL